MIHTRSQEDDEQKSSSLELGEEKRRRMHSLNVCVAATCFPTLLTEKGRLTR